MSNNEQYVIRGGKALEGEVSIAGAKNAALGILAAAVMTDEKVTIENEADTQGAGRLAETETGSGDTKGE